MNGMTIAFFTIHKHTLWHRFRPQSAGFAAPLLVALPNMAGVTLVVRSSHEMSVLELNSAV